MSEAATTPLIRCRETMSTLFGKYIGEANLNIGCGHNIEPAFVNLDKQGGLEVDVLHDLENGLPEEFKDNSFDLVFASHVMEHIVNLTPLMRDIHRVLKPGGYFIAVTPYCSSDDAWDAPDHVRAFSENTWHYFNRKLYKGDHAGSYWTEIDFDLNVVEIILVPMPEFRKDLEIEFKKKHYRNIIQEIHAILIKPKDGAND